MHVIKALISITKKIPKNKTWNWLKKNIAKIWEYWFKKKKTKEKNGIHQNTINLQNTVIICFFSLNWE